MSALDTYNTRQQKKRHLRPIGFLGWLLADMVLRAHQACAAALITKPRNTQNLAHRNDMVRALKERGGAGTAGATFQYLTAASCASLSSATNSACSHQIRALFQPLPSSSSPIHLLLSSNSSSSSSSSSSHPLTPPLLPPHRITSSLSLSLYHRTHCNHRNNKRGGWSERGIRWKK